MTLTMLLIEDLNYSIFHKTGNKVSGGDFIPVDEHIPLNFVPLNTNLQVVRAKVSADNVFEKQIKKNKQQQQQQR